VTRCRARQAGQDRAEGVDGELANRGIEEQARNALLQVFLPPTSRDRVASFVPGRSGKRPSRTSTPSSTLAAEHERAGKLKFDPSLAAGSRTTPARSWRSTSRTWPAALAAAAATTTSVGMFLGQNIPACGFSLGLERILVVMTERNMFPPTLATTPADVMIATFDAAGAGAAMRLAAILRRGGLRVLVYPDAEKIGQADQVR
jgi:histidyl-tRNA synthetase